MITHYGFLDASLTIPPAIPDTEKEMFIRLLFFVMSIDKVYW